MSSKKKGCGCFGCTGGCCGIVIIIIIVLIATSIASFIWLKNRTYINQPEKITSLAREICDYKLPDTFTPVIGADYGIFRFVFFMTQNEMDSQNIAAVYFIDTTITNLADMVESVAAEIYLLAVSRVGGISSIPSISLIS